MVISVAATGTHLFPLDPPRGVRSPPLAQWRCNLTALSQLHNLYFVASGSFINVYIPTYPTQKLANEPVLLFFSQPSADRLTGQIDPRIPHAINHLIVQFLGNEEVVAVVRDDGDVDAFLVRHVVSAITRREEPGNDLPATAAEVRPFFQANVGKSAWGLAIHSQARILATSSNLCEVRIFKFGLLQEDSDSDDEDAHHHDAQTTGSLPLASGNTIPSDNDGNDKDIQTETQQRRTDTTHRLTNGSANIPHIAFCNTPDDPTGRWLLTTDISGDTRLIDVHALRIVQKFRFAPTPFHATIPGAFDRLNAGWLVMFLDRRAFGVEEGVEAALGLERGEQLQHWARGGEVWDLSRTVGRLPESGEAFVFHGERRGSGGRGGQGDSEMGDGHEDADEGSDGDESDGGARIEIEADFEDSSSSEEGDSGSEARRAETAVSDAGRMDGNDNQNPRAEEQEEEASQEAEAEPDSDSSPDSLDLILIDDGEDPDDEMTEDTIPFTSWYNGTSIAANKPQFAYPTLPPSSPSRPNPNPNPGSPTLPPILHTSPHNIYLLQPHTFPADTPPTPTLGFANPLRQTIQHELEYLRHFARLNMYASIPELGVVVLASQKGRAIVVNLTRIPAGAEYPAYMLASSTSGPSGDAKARKSARVAAGGKETPSPPPPQQQQRPEWAGRTVYAMRVGCIIPFVQQERRNSRPPRPLVGIAAAPLQGYDGRGASLSTTAAAAGKGRRWRIMLHYQDHSVLSYEIWREEGGGDKGETAGRGVDFESVVV